MSKHILVVEDDDAIAAFVATALEREGYGVARVRTGREAMSHVQSSPFDKLPSATLGTGRAGPPDLVLLDLMLPGDMDGLRVCQAIRRGEAYIPVIIVTAKDEDVDKVVGLELGADDYILSANQISEIRLRQEPSKLQGPIRNSLPTDWQVQCDTGQDWQRKHPASHGTHRKCHGTCLCRTSSA